MLFIAAMHIFRIGTYFEGNLRTLYYSYFSDIIIPFGFYFLLCLNEISFSFLRPWKTKALLVFSTSTLTEVLQAFDIYFLGLTFDYFDIVAFGFGAFLAVVIDELLFKKYIPNWNYSENKSQIQ